MKRLINNLSRSSKISILIIVDTIVIITSLFTSFLIRLDLSSIIINFQLLSIISLLLVPFIIIILYLASFYQSITRYGGLSIFKSILISSFLGSFILIAILYFGNFSFKISYSQEPTNIIRSIPILFSLVLAFLLLSSRYFVQIIIEILFIDNSFYPIGIYSYSKNLIKVADFLEENFNLKVKLFLSSSGVFIGNYINKIIVNNIEDKNSIKNKNLKYIFVVDLPTNNDEKSKVLEKLTSLDTTIKFFNFNPTKKIPFEDKLFEDIDIDLLLSRERLEINYSFVSEFLLNKEILVTGGGGSIGSELCLQLLKFKIKKLIIVEKNEFNLFNIKKNIENLNLQYCEIEYKLIDITDISLLDNVFKYSKINIIYHAAAYKHVIFGGVNLANFFKNNFLGTKILLDLSIKFKVNNFMLVSTDKATNPINVMGLTKFLSECLCNYYHNHNKEIIINRVRFGNVLGTSGSVIPVFKEQILKGGPVTVSDRNVKRYFMTKEEAVELILYSSKLGKSNELFYLDMGKPVNIYNMACKMINLLGRNIKSNKNKTTNGNDVEIIFKGLEKGEKLDEVVHTGQLKKTEHPRINISINEEISNSHDKYLMPLIEILEKDNAKLEDYIKNNFSSITDIV